MLLLLLRTLLLYAVLLVGERLMGKRQIGQLQTSELVSTLLLSELAVLPIQNGGDPLWRGLLPHGGPDPLRGGGVPVDAEKRQVPAAGVRQAHGGGGPREDPPGPDAPPAHDHRGPAGTAAAKRQLLPGGGGLGHCGDKRQPSACCAARTGTP